MKHAELAARLVEAGNAEREVLLRENSVLADVTLAYALKEICYDAFTVEPTRSVQSATALKALATHNPDPEIGALAEWVAGIGGLVEGQMERVLTHLDEAERRLLLLGKDHTAAATQVSKLIALAMLGHYDEAIECGLRARAVFLAHDDALAAGKIENNIGNLYFRRDRYLEAKEFQSSARGRFAALSDRKQLAIIDNSLANTRALLHEFKAAEELYEEAVRLAEDSGLTVTLAEIEGNLGSFALLQGRYDRALDYLERSRRRYAALGMPHQSAIAEQEIADAYLELNLAPEAAEIYTRVTRTFAELGLRAEEARSLLYHGRAAILLGQSDKAHALLAAAREHYAIENNAVGAAMVQLTGAQLSYGEGEYAQARTDAAKAQVVLATAGALRRALVARWLVAECARAEHKSAEATQLLEAILSDPEAQEHPDIISRCNTSLGLVAAAAGQRNLAEACFRRSIAIIEGLRAPLPAEEFRSAFFSDKLVPYHAMVQLCLEDENRVAEAFLFVEQARGRALADTLGTTSDVTARDQFEADLLAQLEDLRQELNYFYHQLERPVRGGAPHSEGERTMLQQALREREKRSLEIMRQLQARGDTTFAAVAGLDLAGLQSDLAAGTALVEYTSIADELLAFVVTDQSVSVVRNLGSQAEIEAELGQLRFQIESLRHGSAGLRRHLPDLTKRALKHLQALYDRLLRPIERLIGGRRLVIVPHRALHYLPFQALHDGSAYLIERCELSYAPSARVLQQCLARSRPQLNKALLLGVADAQTPRVRDEIAALESLFPETTTLLNQEATVDALRQQAPLADVIHLACHGQFRPDNPLFSSLRLGDGWLTVRDAYNLNLRSALVTLSACETGVNEVAPGEELIGLARGFFAAGAASLLISLWTVDDEATAQFMIEFYTHLRDKGSPAAAFRQAQLRLMQSKPHPFFWSPFVLLGRW
jgi:CHAT domain-containing protein/tetratricopeptide (TPR) repeat protein